MPAVLVLIGLVVAGLGQRAVPAGAPHLAWALSPSSNTVTIRLTPGDGHASRQILARSQLMVSEDGNGRLRRHSPGRRVVRIPVPPGRQTDLHVQVEGPFHLAQLVIPGMRAKGRGWILNISSIAARHPAMPPTGFASRGGTVYGMCKAALERFSTGLAAELYADDIAVNALSPTKVVPTPGTLFHHLTSEDDPNNEPPSVMAEAALLLCSGEPKTLTGRIAYSQELLAELAPR